MGGYQIETFQTLLTQERGGGGQKTPFKFQPNSWRYAKTVNKVSIEHIRIGFGTLNNLHPEFQVGDRKSSKICVIVERPDHIIVLTLFESVSWVNFCRGLN